MPLVDLHLHLLPGVDAGVREATVTPHVGHPDYPLDPATIAARTQALQAAIDAAAIPLRLHPGGEIHPDAATGLGHAALDAVAHGPPGSRWVLLEVPFAGIDPAFLAACRHVRDHGFGLLIAHPERAAGLLTDGAAAALLAGTSAVRTEQITQANPRFLLEHGIPHGPDDEPRAWRSRHESRVRAAMAAARSVR